MLKNNDFGNDKDDDRTDRADLMSENIDGLAVTIGVTGALLTWGQNVSANWSAARVAADTEGGQDDVAYQLYHEKFDEAKKAYAENKELLIAIIGDLKANDEIVEEYQIKGRIPITRGGLKTAIEDWKKTHDELTLAGDLRVIPDPLVTEMVGLKDEFDALWRLAVKEKGEAVKATEAKEALFREDCDKFRIVFRLAKIALGADHSDLRLIGFVPASEVWTEGSGDPDPEQPTVLICTCEHLGGGTVEFKGNNPVGVARISLELRALPEGLWQPITDLMMLDGEFIPHRENLTPGEYEAKFTPFDADGEPGEPVIVVFTVTE